jgi:ubiquinone/menaquinone biosynthesis C-methylase UbiE
LTGICHYDGAEMSLKTFLARLLKPRGKSAFFNQLSSGCRVLDVGCGNDSPFLFKSRFPKGHYTGIDVSDYRHSVPIMADAYHVTTSAEFAEKIAEFDSAFDAVTSSHNLEHCENREATLAAMAQALKPGGLLYLSFPSSASVDFPSRAGTLNYKDDETHLGEPPELKDAVRLLKENGLDILFQVDGYRPFLLRMLGTLREQKSKALQQVMTGTWEYYGFESIIWAKKK